MQAWFTILHQHPTLNQFQYISTPIFYIELKFNIFFDPKQIKKFATAPMWFVFFDSTYQLSTLNQIQYIVPIEIRNLLSAPSQFTICYSIPTSYKFNIFSDTIPWIHCTNAPTGFAILHQHPTNSIYFWIQHKQIIQQSQRNSLFCDWTPTSYIETKFNILFNEIFWSNINIKVCNSANVIRVSGFAILNQHCTVEPNSI